MAVSNGLELSEHVGHEIVCVSYGTPTVDFNVAIECESCMVVLVDYDME